MAEANLLRDKSLPMADHPLLRRLPKSNDCSNDELLAAFLDYVAE
jgi:hypothetical protein